jgi:hypothetical protein
VLGGEKGAGGGEGLAGSSPQAGRPPFTRSSAFYQAISNMKNQEVLCVKNYDAGASFIESYTDFEHLDKDTRVVSRSYNTSNNGKDFISGNASLEAHIDSMSSERLISPGSPKT